MHLRWNFEHPQTYPPSILNCVTIVHNGLEIWIKILALSHIGTIPRGPSLPINILQLYALSIKQYLTIQRLSTIQENLLRPDDRTVRSIVIELNRFSIIFDLLDRDVKMNNTKRYK